MLFMKKLVKSLYIQFSNGSARRFKFGFTQVKFLGLKINSVQDLFSSFFQFIKIVFVDCLVRYSP